MNAGWAGCLGLAIALLAGCKSAGYVKSDAAAASLQEAAASVRAESRALESTTGALNDLVNAPSGDLRLQFERYSHSLDQLTAATNHAHGIASRLERKRTAYLDAWEKGLLAINDEELRKRSEARKVEVTNQYETTYQHYRESQDALTPLVGYSQDVRKALQADLTVAGLQAVKPSAASVKDKAATVQGQLTQSATELDDLGGKMSSFVLQPAK